MKRLIIVGAGAFGREVLEWVRHLPECGRDWTPAGFLDDSPDVLNGYETGLSLLGPIGAHQPRSDELFICAIGKPSVKKKALQPLLSKDATFISLVHPSAIVGRNVSLGTGCVLCPKVVLTCDISLGNFVTLNIATTIGHDVKIGSWSTLSGHCDVTGYSQLGEEVFLGSHACVLPKVKVGDGAVVGAGVTAIINVPKMTTLACPPPLRISGTTPIFDVKSPRILSEVAMPHRENTFQQMLTSGLTPKTVLVSSAGRRHHLIRCFREDAARLGIALRVIGTDIDPGLSAACHSADRSFQVPRCDRDEFIPALLDICRQEHVDLLIPTIDPELLPLAKSRAAFAEVGTRVVVSSPEVVALAGDKSKTAKILATLGVDTPLTIPFADLKANPGLLPWPVIIKPNGGSASVGIFRPSSPEDLKNIPPRADLIAQECLQGREYTVNLFFSTDGVLRCAIPHLRIEVRGGEVSKGVTEDQKTLIQAAKKIATGLSGACGPLCFQAIVSLTGRIAIFEINARFGGGFPLAHHAGARFSQWLLEQCCDLPSTASDSWKSGVTMLRYDDAVFSDA